MGTRVVNTDPAGQTREIADTGDIVGFGAEVELETELAERLLEQEGWDRPTTKSAKRAEKEK